MTAPLTLVTTNGKTAADHRARLLAEIEDLDREALKQAHRTADELMRRLAEVSLASTLKPGPREKAMKLREYIAGEMATITALDERR